MVLQNMDSYLKCHNSPTLQIMSLQVFFFIKSPFSPLNLLTMEIVLLTQLLISIFVSSVFRRMPSPGNLTTQSTMLLTQLVLNTTWWQFPFLQPWTTLASANSPSSKSHPVGTQPCLFDCILSIAAFVFQGQSHVIAVRQH